MTTFFINPLPEAFRGLPWQKPLEAWAGTVAEVVDLPRGLSRHTVTFITEDGVLYALKSLPANQGQSELSVLRQAESLRLPVVSAFGLVILDDGSEVLITNYLVRSLPYRSLFMSSALERYRQSLMDAMAGLMVRLHLTGFYWGDCSLSNTLFRRDASILQAYLVDAECSAFYSAPLAPDLRLKDMEILEENVQLELTELASENCLPEGFSHYDTSTIIRRKYHQLWDLVNKQETIQSGEHYRIAERIRQLNLLGFSARDAQLIPTPQGDQLRLKISVTDRSYHRDKLFDITGMQVEEMQARTLVNEIEELRVRLSQERSQNVALDAAAYYWQEQIFKPIMNELSPLAIKRQKRQNEADPVLNADPAELYCQLLEHKWFLSERAQHDVGHHAALADYLRQFGE